MNKNEFRVTISRSFTRKLNLSNYLPKRQYESVDFFSSHSIELPVETSEVLVKKMSEELYKRAKLEVEDCVAKFLHEEIEKIPRKNTSYIASKYGKTKKDLTEAKFEEDCDLQAILDQEEASKE